MSSFGPALWRKKKGEQREMGRQTRQKRLLGPRLRHPHLEALRAVQVDLGRLHAAKVHGVRQREQRHQAELVRRIVDDLGTGHGASGEKQSVSHRTQRDVGQRRAHWLTCFSGPSPCANWRRTTP